MSLNITKFAVIHNKNNENENQTVLVDIVKSTDDIRDEIENIICNDEIVTYHEENFLVNFEEYDRIIKKYISNPKLLIGTYYYTIDNKLFMLLYDNAFKKTELLENGESFKYDDLFTLGCQIISGNLTNNNIVIIKMGIDISKITYEPLQEYELKNLFLDIFIKKGICISENGDVQEYEYTQNYLDNATESYGSEYIHQNYKTDEFSLCDYVLVIATNTDNKLPLNKKATNIIKKFANVVENAYGNAFIAIYKKSNHQISISPFISLDTKTFKITYDLITNTKFYPIDEEYNMSNDSINIDDNIIPKSFNCTLALINKRLL